ncbi:hypothetical protein ATCC51562_1808 [Campylobacter concisus ATCC 51562]|uniref:Uncharacterized protein n=1 Tax=Campylobacter concisus ATCC 51562 TaxID=1242969 RepID=U2GCL5_9BACT|nr:hypothetical protein ATCC51562_1808 [Campylobacter concisus ATCC 51562]
MFSLKNKDTYVLLHTTCIKLNQILKFTNKYITLLNSVTNDN